jgi:molybdopterin/thiamine biosynthesis adenylyltransferase
MTAPLSDAEITRYARQLILPEIGDAGQDALKATRLAIIGAGGLGTPALIAAASAGFGHITIIDDDVIEATNLNRQFLFHEEEAGQSKAERLAKAARAQNPHISITALDSRFTADNADKIIAAHDVIIDASDNAETRYRANRSALSEGRVLIFVSAIRFEGQLAVFAPAQEGGESSGCYECLFPQNSTPAPIANCATAGIAGPVTMMMGGLACLEAIKIVTKSGESLAGNLMLFDGLSAHSDIIKTKRDKNCPACGSL